MGRASDDYQFIRLNCSGASRLVTGGVVSWRLSSTLAMRYVFPNQWLEQLGLLSLKQLWCDLAPLRGIPARREPACQVVWGGSPATVTLTRFIRYGKRMRDRREHRP